MSGDLPNATVATMVDGEIKSVKMRDLFRNGTYILVGVPGAFTPVCTKDHLPTLIDQADKIRVRGIQEIYCISDDNPWAMDEWRKTLDNNEKVKFLSDGNREFLDKIKISASEDFIFIKGKYGRFYAIIEDNMIKRLRFENSVLETLCTTGECIEADVADFV